MLQTYIICLMSLILLTFSSPIHPSVKRKDKKTAVDGEKVSPFQKVTVKELFTQLQFKFFQDMNVRIYLVEIFYKLFLQQDKKCRKYFFTKNSYIQLYFG